MSNVDLLYFAVCSTVILEVSLIFLVDSAYNNPVTGYHSMWGDAARHWPVIMHSSSQKSQSTLLISKQARQMTSLDLFPLIGQVRSSSLVRSTGSTVHDTLPRFISKRKEYLL